MGDPLSAVGLKDLPKPAQHVVQNGIQVIGQTTILVTNANKLVESTGKKFKKFHAMIKNLDPKPDIIAVQELGGYSGGKEKIRISIVGALRMYDCVLIHPETDDGYGRPQGWCWRDDPIQI